MSDSTENMSISIGDQVVCIRITGRANMHASVGLDKLVSALFEQGHSRFVLDLTDCQLMDSTFLGVLARFGVDAKEEDSDQDHPQIELLNPGDRIRQLLDDLGLVTYFKYLHGSCESLLVTPLEELPAETADRKEIAQTMLEAHKTLMKINPDNIPKFKDVTIYLEEELKDTQPAPGDAKNESER